MKSFSLFRILCLGVLLSACVPVSMEEVSSDPEYAGAVGKQIRTKEDLWVLGITSDKNYAKRIDYMVLVPGVGFSGPEVVERDRLGRGTNLRITKVLKSESSFSPRILYVVEEIDSPRFSAYELRVALTQDIHTNIGLDSNIFSVIP